MPKFIHAADIHLDSPMRGLAAYEGAPVEALRGATRGAFRNLVDTAIREQVAFLVIAGDLYDTDWRDFNTGLFFSNQMARLNAAAIPVYLLHGNHDAESEIRRSLALPDNVHIFRASKPQTFKLSEHRIALHGQSFRTRELLDNLVPAYPGPLAGWLNIGVLHTALEGDAEHATYAPCSVAELIAKGYDYWALGHVHAHRVVHRDPWIVFPGNLQGRKSNETGPKGAVLVTVEDGRIQAVDRLLSDVVRWAHLEVDVSASADAAQALGVVGQRLDRLYEDSASRSVAVRITLTGQTPLHAELIRDELQLEADLRARAQDVANDKIWIEKFRLRTTGVAAPAHATSEPIGDLAALLDEVARDPAVLEDIDGALRDMLARVPQELQQASTELGLIRDGRVAELAQELKPTVMALVERPG